MGEQECAIKVTNRKHGVLQNFEFYNFFCYELKCTSPSGSSMSLLLSLNYSITPKMTTQRLFYCFTFTYEETGGQEGRERDGG